MFADGTRVVKKIVDIIVESIIWKTNNFIVTLISMPYVMTLVFRKRGMIVSKVERHVHCPISKTGNE